MDPALTPSRSRDRALTVGLAALLLLGAQQAAVDLRPAFALSAIGRPAAWSWAPQCALLSLQVLALAMVLSRFPRAAAATACAVIAGLYAAVPATYHNNHYLLFVSLLLVAIAPTDPAAPVGLARIVRWQLTLVYLSSVVVKLAHPWWRGSGAVIRWLATTRAPEANPDALLHRALGPLLSASMPSRLADVAVTLIEIALPLGLAARRTRTLSAVVGVLLHITMQEWLFPQLFTFMMLLGYFAWSPADDRAWKLRLPLAVSSRPLVARALTLLDPLRRVEVIADSDLTTWAISDPAGRRFQGGWALLQLASITPLTVMAYAALALLFPEVRGVGPVARDAFENLLVGALVLAFAASSLQARGLRSPGRNVSHPN